MNNLHYTIMFFIMILSGLLSTMNVWVDKYDDIRFSLNDAYMILLMTGWMFFFMGIVYQDITVILIGVLLVSINIYFIRTQIHMSKKLLEKKNNIKKFLKTIINTQQKEILFLKD